MKKQIIDFYADWCGPCRYIKPFFKELEERYPDIEFITINVDEDEEATLDYQVTAMPTFIFIADGIEVDRLRGANVQELERKTISLYNMNSL